MRAPWLFGLISLAVGCGAQGLSLVPASPLDAFPECSHPCFLNTFALGICDFDDQLCICTSEAFAGNVTECVVASCTIPEGLAVRNESLTTCGAPVRDQQNDLVIRATTMFGFAVFIFLVRIIYKLVMKLDFGLDDLFLTLTTVVSGPQIAIMFLGTIPNGIGKDIWTLTADQITQFLKFWYITAILYFLQTALVKLAFISFYLRIFTSRRTQRLLWITFVFVMLWGVAFVVLAILVCNPVSYLWTQWDGLHEGKCVDDKSYVWTNAIMNIILDFWIIAIPLWELRKLQLHWKKKVGVIMMFCLGAFVTVVSILRLKSLVYYQHRSNVTWDFYEVNVWSSIEIGVGVICACLPTIRLILVKIWPVLSGSTIRRSNAWYKYGSGKTDSTARSSRIMSPASPSREMDPGMMESGMTRVAINGRKVGWAKHAPTNTARPEMGAKGVHLSQSFAVNYSGESDGSDISLVLMNTEPAKRNPHREKW